MAVEKEMTIEKKNNAIDMLVALTVAEISEDFGIEPDEAFSKFLMSKTGELLYDEDSKLWWNGPSYIADLYREEIAQKYKIENRFSILI